MADTATQLPNPRRRLRWPLLFAAIAVLAVISVKWLVPIAMEQRAIAAIRADCPDVDIDVPEFMPDGRKGPSSVGWMHLITPGPDTTLVRTDFAGPTVLQKWTDHGFVQVVSIDGSAAQLRPAVSQLPWLQHVERVTLKDAADDDLAHIGQLMRLTDLDLSYGEGITDAGLVHLPELSQLKKLCLKRANITDAGLQHLLSLTNLEDLDLSETHVTFDGLRQLHVLPNLRHLRLDGMKLTDPQRDQLDRALPGCDVTRY